jgi:hypothetical protein
LIAAALVIKKLANVTEEGAAAKRVYKRGAPATLAGAAKV